MAIIEQLKDLLTKVLPDVDFSLSLGVCAGIVIILLFCIALAISAGCKITKYRKKLIASTKKIGSYDAITDENVDVVYKEVEGHPDGVQKGWAAFMDQRVGYPSDYITAQNVIEKREFSGKGAFAKVFLIVLGVIVCALSGIVGFMSVEFEETMNVLNVISALEFLIIPVALYVICLLLLDIAFNRKIRRLGFNFISFCEMLDAKVVVSDREEREFVSDNLDEINKRVEELIAGRMNDEEIIEVITAPKVEEIEEVEEEPVEEPVEEKPAEETVEPVKEESVEEEPILFEDLTEEEKENYFRVLVALVDEALADETQTEDDYALIAATIYDNAMETGAMKDPDDAAVFEECFRLLAERIAKDA